MVAIISSAVVICDWAFVELLLKEQIPGPSSLGDSSEKQSQTHDAKRREIVRSSDQKNGPEIVTKLQFLFKPLLFWAK